jgi:anti-sigma factor RsiW
MSLDHISSELLMRRLDAELPPEAQPALDAHLAACAECSARYARLRAISGAIDGYSAGLLGPQPSAQRRALVDALESRPAPIPKTALAALAIAACLVLAVGISLLISKPAVRPASPVQLATDRFIALPYSDDSLSAEGAVVLQVEVPRSAVALAGIPVGDGPADGRVKAEVIVGADGLARAIRFLN